MPVVTVLDSFLKTIILVENYRLRFKISGSGPAGTLDPPLSARFERFIRFWTDTLCPPGVTLGHVLASEARMHTAVLCVRMCTCCAYVYVCVLYLCVYVALCPFMFVFDGVLGLFW